MRKPRITQTRLEREYKRLSGVKHVLGETDRRGVIMLACLAVGPIIGKLINVLSYPQSEIEECLGRMEKAKILQGGKLAIEWLGKDGGIAFICDHLVIEGLLNRE